jgi:hypothetical protein
MLMPGCGDGPASVTLSQETNQQAEDRTKGMMEAMKKGAYSKPAPTSRGVAK